MEMAVTILTIWCFFLTGKERCDFYQHTFVETRSDDDGCAQK